MNYDRRVVHNLKRRAREPPLPYLRLAFYFACLVLILSVLLRELRVA